MFERCQKKQEFNLNITNYSNIDEFDEEFELLFQKIGIYFYKGFVRERSFD